MIRLTKALVVSLGDSNSAVLYLEFDNHELFEVDLKIGTSKCDVIKTIEILLDDLRDETKKPQP